MPGLRLTQRSYPAVVLPTERSALARVSKRATLAGAAGLLLFAGHPPFDLGWVAPLALVPLLLLAREVSDDRAGRAGFVWGFVAGAVFFGLLLVWISRFGVLPWLLLSSLQALSVALFVSLLALWRDRPLRPLVAVALWVGLEAARTTWPLGGFPWGVLGYTQHNGGLLLPIARTLGVLGISAACAIIAVAIEHAWRRSDPSLAGRQSSGQRLAVPAAVIAAVAGGAVILSGTPPQATERTLDIAAVQGNTLELPPLADRASMPRITEVADLMLDATEALADNPPVVTVWPENALDADVSSTPRVRRRVAEALDILDGGVLLAGELLDGEEPGTFRNAVSLYRGSPQRRGVHIKRKLVPFGEYVPLRQWLSWYPALQHVPADGVPGNEATVFEVGPARLAPVTCYESLYPELVRAQVRNGAELLVVSTNNASYGRSAASAQHLAFSRLRAVETGRWVLHAGISGISAVVDPDGSTSQETQLFEQAVVRAELPLITAHTPYTRYGDVVGRTAMLLTLGVALVLLLHRRRP